MRYISTRGSAPALNFEEVVLTGMAGDGGLYVPETIPQFTHDELAAMAGLPYTEIAFRVMKPFVGGEIGDATFREIIDASYATFKHDAVVPLKQLDCNHHLLELFHGPTLAFKDVALQLLGRLLDHFLAKRGEKGVITVPGIVFMRGGSIGVLVILECDGEEFTILTNQARVPVGGHAVPEIPAGMIDGAGNFSL